MPLFMVENTDGSVRVLQADDAATEIIKWPPAEQLAVSSVTTITKKDLPSDRVFRGAWVKSGSAVVVDIGKAREIQRQHIEAAREATMRRLLLREALGDNVAARKAQVAAVDAAAIVAVARDETELRASKPAVLD